MSHDATVNAGDIARLADVGRAAVSNWRRRYDDFPQPVGGTASSPLFSLPEIEEWLRKNGKSFEVSLGDRVWQGLRAAVDDLRLGELAGFAGAFLLYVLRDPDGWRRIAAAPDLVVRLPREVASATPDLPVRPGTVLEDAQLIRWIADLSALHGPATAFEFVCERYVEAHTRRLAVTRGEVAALMGRLARQSCPAGGVVLDPAVGVGTLLLSVSDTAVLDGGPPGVPPARDAGVPDGVPGVPPVRLLGQEINETSALLASLRLLLRGADARVVAGDSLRHDGFVGRRADVVLCDPPFNERAWGHEELIGDPRWDYGVPPRGEPELAWVQHCLAHARPGGLVAILMPAAAAARRSGRRIRANLLRAGALRAVITLSAAGPDLWLLRRPHAGEPSPASILLADASDDLSIVESAWRAYLADTAHGGTARAEAEADVPVRPGAAGSERRGSGRTGSKRTGSGRTGLERTGPVAAADSGSAPSVPAGTPGEGPGPYVPEGAGAWRPADALGPARGGAGADADDGRVERAGGELPRSARIVRIIDLLDDEVDVSPARHVSSRSDPHRYPAAGRRLRDLAESLAEAAGALPELEVLSGRSGLPTTAITDLVKAGMVTIRHSVLKAAERGDLGVLTADDLERGGPPSGRTANVPGLVTVAAGDVVASPTAVRVIEQSGAVLGPQLSLYRVDRSRLDADFLAGFLRYAAVRVHPGASRVDVRRARLPRLPLTEQQAYGAAFRRLAALEDAIREAAEAGEALIRLGLEGLVDGRLRPRA
ncbi:HsdM family class I SAM-dependent methyltransferase [Microtetraspora niveoalba]|uniref:HsdM family class I SAM-dependent methyltransferase n=1 Tax=Microtetraspora niveoalba TaxID=46175 RepID=UPI00082FD2A6|nr:N-6 DNA methylase [Microtetraspora niveoalba]